MRILTISPYYAKFGLGSFYHRAFQQLGHKSVLMSLFETTPWASRSARLLMGLCHRNAPLRNLVVAAKFRRILDVSVQLHPELIFVIQGTYLPPWFVSRLKEVTAAPLFLYYGDNPWVFEKEKSYFWKNLPAWDCVFTFIRSIVPAALYQRGARLVEYLPYGYDPDVHSPRRPSSEMSALYTSPIAYLGTWGPIEEEWLRPLVPYGLKIWGNLWEKAGKDVAAYWQRPGRWGSGQGDEMSFVCQSATIVVNFIRSERLVSHALKTFELPACGGFVLSTRTDEQLEYFPEDKCAVYFSTKDEMIDKLEFYLSHDQEREQIRQTGLEQSKLHTFSNRARRVLTILEEIGRKA